MTDVIGGQLHLTLGTYSSLGPQVKAGRLRALAVTSKTRTRTAPEIPTIAEGGFKDFDATTWYGISVAAGTPKMIVSRLYSEIAAILRQPEMDRRLVSEGVDVIASRPAEFDALIRTETTKWARVIKQAGIKGEQQ
jgi:tripartite-type tricarboxylate transporter receptor subunit TctC